MVAGISCNYSIDKLFAGLGGHEVERPPDFEGASSLQVFALEIQWNSQLFGIVVRIDQLAAANPLFEPVICIVNQVSQGHIFNSV